MNLIGNLQYALLHQAENTRSINLKDLYCVWHCACEQISLMEYLSAVKKTYESNAEIQGTDADNSQLWFVGVS